ncbi:kinetochore scaffold 1 isoform X2 [Dunckerocampus dactyliophorus]|uniref:kinetochore scaffold 1 isoform X2 n=1 Tax=Dunckerocampus dactyliophorus TaxID=161453 RepID=UPI002406F7D2|nr:kinetochore scaffold 1 isoform X2 [Dunckerocampus dactyliophorus]
MEPLDPGRNDENSGFSKRRISSILKAPRKSIKFSDPEQQENQVESAKPVEKRNSRRVSFAPANDVLLFPKDAKNTSSGRSPLQELMPTTVPTQNRLQVSSEDGIQQIMGMETLLSAPLHASDQKEKVISNTDFGEKTVIYCVDDGIMDMTQSHTINIDVDYLVDTPQKNNFNLFQSGESTVMPSEDCGSMGMSLSHNVDMARGFDFPSSCRNTDFSLPVSSFDPTLTIFPSGLSKPTGLNVKLSDATVDTNLSQTKTQKVNVDKENHVPSSVKNTGNVRESSRGCALSQDDDVNMDMTHNRPVKGLTDDNDNPFQCLFPSQEMYSRSDRGSPESQKQASTTPGLSKSKASGHRFHRGKAEEEHTEKTVRFTADDAYMDMTQSHPVKIPTDVSAPPDFDNVRKTVTSVEKRHRHTVGLSSSANNLNSGFFASLLKPKDTSVNSGYSRIANPVLIKEPSNGDPVCPQDDLSMDMTEVQTGHIEIAGINDPLHYLRPAQEMRPQGGQNSTQQLCTERHRSSYNTGKEMLLESSFRRQMTCGSQGDCREKTLRFTDDSALMDVTQSHTVNIACVLPVQSHKNVANLPTNEERSVRFSANGATMDVTQNHTMNIATHVEPGEHHNVDIVPVGGEKTLRFTADDAAMDVTQSHTVNIDTHFEPHIKTNVDIWSTRGDKTLRFSTNDAAMNMTGSRTANFAIPVDSGASHNANFLHAGGEKTVRFTADDAAMDVTRSHTVSIDTHFEPHTKTNVDILSARGEKTLGIFEKDAAMKVAQSHTANIATYLEPAAYHNVNFVPAGGEKTVKFSADDAAMDVTRSHTVNIDTHFDPHTKTNMDILPVGGERTERFSADDAAMDMTRSHTVILDTHFKPRAQNVHCVPVGGEKTMRFSADDAAMDVTRSHTVNIDTHLEPRTNQNVDVLPTGGEKTLRFSANDAAMDVTRSHTVNIDTHFEPRSKQNVDSLPTGEERTLRVSVNDADVNVTQGHAVKICSHLEPGAHHDVNFVPVGGERTVRFTADDAAMDVTRSHTVDIDTHFKPGAQIVDCVSVGGDKTMRFTADDAAMDVTRSHTVDIDTHFKPGAQIVDCVPVGGDKTMRFSADDAAMDVTRSHTANIDTHFEPETKQNCYSLPTRGERTLRVSASNVDVNVTQGHASKIASHFEAEIDHVNCVPVGGEKTLRFSATDAAMDVTRSHTVNIDTHFEPRTKQNVDVLLTGGEKTLRFSANDADVNVTQGHAAKIASHLEPGAHHDVNFVPAGGVRTVKFTADDAAMDVIRSHTVDIDTPLKSGAQNVDCVPAGGEKIMRFSADDAAMDETQSHAVNTDTPFEPHTITNVDILPVGEKTLRFPADDAALDSQRRHTVNIAGNSFLNEAPPTQKREEMTILPRNKSLSVLGFNTGFKKTGFSWANPMITREEPSAESSFQETGDTDHFIPAQPKTPCMDNESEVQALLDSGVNEITNLQGALEGAETDVGMNLTEVQTGLIVVEKFSDEPPHSRSSTRDPDACLQETRKATSSQSNQESGLSKQDGMEISNVPDHVDSKETKIRKENELRNETSPLLTKLHSPIADDHDSPSRKSRRISLADLQKKVRRLSCMVNTTPETPAVDSCIAPTPCSDPGTDKSPKDENDLPPAVVPDVVDLGNTAAEAQDLPQEYATVETPFKLKTKELMSRLSMGGFKAKLPQRTRVDDPKKANSSHMNSERKSDSRTTTNNIANNLGNWNDDDVSDIYDEELGSCEDLSEILDDRSVPKISENVIPFEGFNIDECLLDVFEEDSANRVPGIKRRLPSDENNTEEEKKLKMATQMFPETVETGAQPHVVKYDGSIIAAPTTRHTMDSSSSTHTSSSRSDSTFKQSMLESQLEDYSSDVQRKLEDGTITVSEFLNLFNIDFVIHNPRQSMLPGRSSFDTDCTLMDVMKDKLINRPKQLVYEADIKSLSEKVEGLNYRMWDLDKPLKTINQALWEEMKNSSENEIKCFGVKLKERNNYFRKMSKVRSHEMKEVLYTGVVQAITDEQEKLRGKVDESEGMIRMLDDCISDLEAELAEIEEKGTDSKPSLKSLQEELKKVNETLNDNERQISELEMQKKQASSKLNNLKADVANLERSIAILNTLNEWRLSEKTDKYAVYTFLNATLHLQLMYKGDCAAEEPEREISHINFTFLLDDKRSQSHARLVHKLLSQYIDGQTAWVKKYPTSNHVQKLLSDVSLVVSHCRLLGEEIRLLKMWGGLRLNIVDISCVDTRVHILFSSLRRCSKFEVTFSVSLDNHIYSLQVHSFNSIYGNTTIQQIETIVESFIPAKKLLTKVVKKINTDLL